MFEDILLAGSFFIGGITVTIIGSLFADWRNHKRNLERLRQEHNYRVRYMQKETFFRKKLEYFERIAKAIEDNVEIYEVVLSGIENEKNMNIIRKRLLDCKLLEMQASPLYSDTLKQTAIGIVKFLMAESEFHKKITEIKPKGNIKKIVLDLKKIKIKIMDAGKETIEKLRQELLSD
jgi:hypothetical protein